MHLSISIFLALASLAAANPVRRNTPASQCTTGGLQCCDSIQQAGSPAASALLGLLGISVQDVTVPVGITCSPITVVGAGGTSCSAQPVCCTDNSFSKC
ncbi:hypothetical protein CPB84DRAFT_1686088 [Gymnopilus junonius]|uniref:Hydrophobin n=1 Tax=Gymnopilus junonius TaxID=109634 RepID=A0A9P5NHJ6_GYMJU|nr:hypothetical protein CPB84DRAFT_1686088 [Gymnopilus junonius]